MLQRSREATTDHIAEDIEDHHVGIFEQMMLLQQLHGLADDVTAATGSSRRASGF